LRNHDREWILSGDFLLLTLPLQPSPKPEEDSVVRQKVGKVDECAFPEKMTVRALKTIQLASYSAKMK